jgi:hypothetical protein
VRAEAPRFTRLRLLIGDLLYIIQRVSRYDETLIVRLKAAVSRVRR